MSPQASPNKKTKSTFSENWKMDLLRILENGPREKKDLSGPEFSKEYKLLKYLDDRGLVECRFAIGDYQFSGLTPEGHEYKKTLNSDVKKSKRFKFSFLWDKAWKIIVWTCGVIATYYITEYLKINL